MAKFNTLFEKPEIYQLWNDALQTQKSEVLETLNDYKTIRQLQDIPLEKIQEIKGIGPVRAKQIKAILRLAKEIVSLPVTNRLTIRRYLCAHITRFRLL